MFFCLTVDSLPFQRKYTQAYEDMKDQIYFMQTDTPVYNTNKKARIAASEVGAHKYTHASTKTQWYQSIFIGPISCGRHDRELPCVYEQSVSHYAELTLTQGRTVLCPHMH